MRRRVEAHRTAQELGARFGESVWTLDRAEALGFTRGRIRSAAAAGTILRLQRGRYVVPDAAIYLATAAPIPRSEALALDSSPADGRDGDRSARRRYLSHLVAAVGCIDDGVASHRSALVAHDLPDPRSRHRDSVPRILEITQRGSTGWRSPGIRVHGCPLPDDHIDDVDGLRVTSLARTAIDNTRGMELPHALIVLDAAMRLLVADGLPEPPTTPSQLRLAVRHTEPRIAARALLDDVIASMWGWPGIRAARAAVSHGDPAAETPLESLSRGYEILGGLPVPELGVPLLGVDGMTYWVDQYWPEYGVIGEADGRLKYTSPQVLYAEKQREDALRGTSRPFVRWTWDEIARVPDRVVARIGTTLRSRGWCP